MHFSFIKNTILEVWKDFLQKENLKLVKFKTEKYSCFFENKNIGLKIYVERYFQRINIEFVRKGMNYGSNIFTLLEFLQGKRSKIYPMLYPMASHSNFNKNFGKRFFLNNPINNLEDFKKTLYFFSQIIQEELPEILKGDFSYLTEYRKQLRESLDRKPTTTEEEKLLLEKDFQLTHYQYPPYPEQKVIDEISTNLKQGRRINEYSKYELTADEKEWIYSLEYPYQNGRLRLSMEYLEAFEKTHNITLPREYKLFFNWIGNGHKKLFKLEQSITYFESPHNGFGHYTFIDLEKPFSPNQDFSKFNGVINLYNYGCGIHHYLVVNGRYYGQVWADDHANSGEFYPIQDKEGNHLGFREWYQQMGHKEAF